jgi:hypothetical protein
VGLYPTPLQRNRHVAWEMSHRIGPLASGTIHQALATRSWSESARRMGLKKHPSCPTGTHVGHSLIVRDRLKAVILKITSDQGQHFASVPRAQTSCLSPELEAAEPIRHFIAGAPFLVRFHGEALNEVRLRGSSAITLRPLPKPAL